MADKNIKMQILNVSGAYDTLYPKTLGKNTIISDSVAAEMGLSSGTTIDQALSTLQSNINNLFSPYWDNNVSGQVITNYSSGILKNSNTVCGNWSIEYSKGIYKLFCNVTTEIYNTPPYIYLCDSSGEIKMKNLVKKGASSYAFLTVTSGTSPLQMFSPSDEVYMNCGNTTVRIYVGATISGYIDNAVFYF